MVQKANHPPQPEQPKQSQTWVQVTQLDVFDGEDLVGSLHDTVPLSFAYSAAWIERSRSHLHGEARAYAIVNIALAAGRNNALEIEAFFENLLPEGEIRSTLSKSSRASTTFSLLLAVAGDTAGGLTILPVGSVPQSASYMDSAWEDLAKHFSDVLQAPGLAGPAGSRASLSGAQTKMLINLSSTGSPMLPIGTSPSTWIIKPNIRGLEQVWSSAVNETIIMRTAAHCGLDVAEVFFEPVTKACVVKRFDRIIDSGGSIVRIKQYDFCQLSGTSSGKKYESEGGPGLSKCAELIRTHSVKPAVDMARFCHWIIFNLLTGNNDSHAKNLSVYSLPGQGLRLTPFYDLMDTRLYSGLSMRFAFKIGGEDQPGKITREHLTTMSKEFNIKPAFLFEIVKTLHGKLDAALQKSIIEISPQLNNSGETLAKKLQQHVMGIADKNAARFLVDSASTEAAITDQIALPKSNAFVKKLSSTEDGGDDLGGDGQMKGLCPPARRKI